MNLIPISKQLPPVLVKVLIIGQNNSEMKTFFSWEKDWQMANYIKKHGYTHWMLMNKINLDSELEYYIDEL